jgi:hypothetical protein
MKTLAAVAAVVLPILFVTAIFPANADTRCDCPKDDPATHGAWQVLIDKEMSSAERVPSVGPLGFPKALTVCMYYDMSIRGYSQDMKLVVEGSIDGHTWFPAMIAGRDVQAATTNGCLSVSPTRYVRVGWAPAANVPAPGPRVTVQVQAAY